MGGATFRDTQVGEEFGCRHRPGSSLVAVTWATLGAEGAGPEEVVRRLIRDEDEHVRRYMWLLEMEYTNTWSVLQRDPYHISYEPVMVPSLWRSCAPRSAPRGLGPGRS